MASGIYERFLANLMGGIVDLDTDVIRVALFDNVHTFTATHNQWSEISANEITGTGYTTKGEQISSPTITQGATTVFDDDGSNTSWTTATFTAYHGVIYDDTLTNDDLIANIDFGGAKTVTAGTFTIQWNASGIITLA